MKIKPSKSEMLSTALKGIGQAIDGLQGGRNPHVVGVRDQLMVLEADLQAQIAARREAVSKRDAAKAAA